VAIGAAALCQAPDALVPTWKPRAGRCRIVTALRVHLFGSVRVSIPGRPDVRLTHRLQPLLAYLLVERRRAHPREALAGLFWGDHSEERARACLNTALWRLRALLEPTPVPRGTYLRTTASGEIAFNTESDYWLDVAVFERYVTRAIARPVHRLDPEDAHRLEVVLRLHTAELLEGCFDDWAVRERARVEGLYVGALEHLMRHSRARGDLHSAMEHGQRILRDDPLREDVHRELMELYAEDGRGAEAVKQFDTCRSTLGNELGIAPAPDTRALYARLIRENGDSRSAEASVDVAPALDAAVDELGGAVAGLRQAHEALERALENVARAATNPSLVSEPRRRRDA
jgi:DNA-binding SARP family transcriptional activator